MDIRNLSCWTQLPGRAETAPAPSVGPAARPGAGRRELSLRTARCSPSGAAEEPVGLVFAPQPYKTVAIKFAEARFRRLGAAAAAGGLAIPPHPHLPPPPNPGPPHTVCSQDIASPQTAVFNGQPVLPQALPTNAQCSGVTASVAAITNTLRCWCCCAADEGSRGCGASGIVSASSVALLLPDRALDIRLGGQTQFPGSCSRNEAAFALCGGGAAAAAARGKCFCCGRF
ncbi:hypothetical protein L1887_52102 [Cichorium endivia]|nr:hypothetical protein L1887_52102 [Cichorium endivia]